MTEGLKAQSDQISRIDFHPKIKGQVPSGVLARLDAIKAELQEKGAAPDAAKFLLVNRNFLNIPDSIMDSCRTTLADHYRLKKETVDRFGLLKDVIACVELERFRLDPAVALKEYGQTQWQEKLVPYAEYQGAAKMSFADFVDSCKAAVVCQKGKELEKQANDEAKRILAMTPQEWDGYCKGERWSQGAHAADVKRERLFIAETVSKLARSAGSLFFVRSEQREGILTELFSKFQTAQSLGKNSEVLVPSHDDLIISRPYFSVDSLLRPRTEREL